MSATATKYFLLVSRPAGEVEVEEWGTDELGAAAAYSERETAFRDQPEVEIVLVGADSLETIRKTHSQYFASSARDFLNQLEDELNQPDAHQQGSFEAR